MTIIKSPAPPPHFWVFTSNVVKFCGVNNFNNMLNLFRTLYAKNYQNRLTFYLVIHKNRWSLFARHREGVTALTKMVLTMRERCISAPMNVPAQPITVCCSIYTNNSHTHTQLHVSYQVATRGLQLTITLTLFTLN